MKDSEILNNKIRNDSIFIRFSNYNLKLDFQNNVYTEDCLTQVRAQSEITQSGKWLRAAESHNSPIVCFYTTPPKINIRG